MKTYSSSLSVLLRGLCAVPAALDTHISGLAIDSRKVKKGDLFIALASDNSSLAEHIRQAVELGANAVLAEGGEGVTAFEDGAAVELSVSELASKAGIIADRFYQSPSQDVDVIGVTGTNGKTSVASYIANYLSLGGRQAGVIGTLGYGLLGDSVEALQSTGHTTPNVVDVHHHLAQLRDSGAQFVVMEVSSHGLCQHRVDAVRFIGAVFTNLSRDHLDYHGSMEEYAQAKARLFSIPSLQFAVINKDDPVAKSMTSAVPAATRVLSYSIAGHTADISVLSDEQSGDGIDALVKASVGQIRINSPLLGRFNLSNLLAVVGVAIAINDASNLEARLGKIRPVAGRMEVVRKPESPVVVIDYAHTPDALKNVLETLRASCRERLRLVFGCGGDRDRGKRAEMAKVAELLADDLIITDDNPRSEAPETIVADMLAGLTDQTAVSVIHERRQAIQQALEQATANDIVLVAGKGHERWQEVKGQRSYFSDLETVSELLMQGSVQSSERREAAHD